MEPSLLSLPFHLSLLSVPVTGPVPESNYRGSGDRCESVRQTISGAFWIENHSPRDSAVAVF